MELKELNCLSKHMKNVRSSQPYISMNFVPKHQLSYVSIVNKRVNTEAATHSCSVAVLKSEVAISRSFSK